MNIHEYQARKLFTDYNIPVPPFAVIDTLSDVDKAVESLLYQRHSIKTPWVLKAQVHAGGRGKAGGIKMVDDRHDIPAEADELLGKRLITKQSYPDGQPVNRLILEKALEIEKEFYLAMLVDRANKSVSVIACREGGTDIEEVAQRDPQAIVTIPVSPLLGVQSYQVRIIAQLFSLNEKQSTQLSQIVFGAYKLFIEKDLTLLEINPLVKNQDGLFALDAKVSIDDNALFRHSELAAWRDPSQEDVKEQKAKDYGLNYIALDGSVGCMVNGAGLAMATMDIIKLYGGNPANFLDVGGGTTKGSVDKAFQVIASDPKVKSVLINIFGGIVRCDLIAEGLIHAAKSLERKLPLVVRLQGTNVEEGKTLLKENLPDALLIDNLDQAAQKAVALAQGKR